jgi:Mg2+ and Co2+ transporter CorA
MSSVNNIERLIEDEIEELEKQLYGGDHAAVNARLYTLRTELTTVRRAMRALSTFTEIQRIIAEFDQ